MLEKERRCDPSAKNEISAMGRHSFLSFFSSLWQEQPQLIVT
jgi:hypothetical protein